MAVAAKRDIHKGHVVRWGEIFDANYDEILAIRCRPDIDVRVMAAYVRVLESYLRSDLESLKSHVWLLRQVVEQDPEKTALLLLDVAEVRLAVREQVESQAVESLLQRLASEIWSDELRGESHFVLERYFDSRSLYSEAKEQAQQAYLHLWRSGVRRKAVRALWNQLVAESRLRPEKNYLNDLQFLLRRAREARDIPTVGSILVATSREYYKLGSFQLALSFANKAVARLERVHGTLDHHLAVAHRCHLFCELGASPKAILDAEFLRTSPFPKVHAALSVLIEKYPSLRQASDFVSSEAPLPSWQEVAEEKSPENLTSLEETVISALLKSPRTRTDLARHIYGDKMATRVSTNRLFNLLNRVRKKTGNVVEFKNGYYFIRDASVLQ
ncbi:MAG: hypothetical protein AB7F86_13275 [Bdellovibrionales bacterium]